MSPSYIVIFQGQGTALSAPQLVDAASIVAFVFGHSSHEYFGHGLGVKLCIYIGYRFKTPVLFHKLDERWLVTWLKHAFSARTATQLEVCWSQLSLREVPSQP